MNCTSTQFVSSRRMDMYVPIHQISTWGEDFKSNGNLNTSASMIVEVVDANLDNQSEDTSRGTLGPSITYNQEGSKHREKVQRRLAQNRVAARKSRLRKKAYVQQLETSRLKLIEMEQQLDQARQQGLYRSGGLEASHMGFSGTVNSGIAAFEMDYGNWVEEEKKLICELRLALDCHISDIELHILVENGMSRYFELFRLKATAARADAFYVMSGMWQTSAERFFLWIGGVRPSELLKMCTGLLLCIAQAPSLVHGSVLALLLVLVPRLDPLTDEQVLDVYDLRQSCQQAEDALSQGMVKLHQTLAEIVAVGQLATAMERLEDMVSFINQADHLRQETLQQMYRILTTRQAARGLLALGEYFQFLRTLSSLWAARPSENA